MTHIAVLFRSETLMFDTRTMSESFRDNLQERLARVGGKVLSWSPWKVKMEMCPGQIITISQMHTIEPWLSHGNGDPWFYLDVEVNVPNCDDSYDGALGQTYKCEYVSGEKQFVWSHDQEESFRLPTLSAPTAPFQVDSTCPDKISYDEDDTVSKDQKKKEYKGKKATGLAQLNNARQLQ
jgi:hypothetical protein